MTGRGRAGSRGGGRGGGGGGGGSLSRLVTFFYNSILN